MIVQDRFTKADPAMVLELLRVLSTEGPVTLDSLGEPWVRMGRIAVLQVHDAFDLAYMPGVVCGRDVLAHVDGSGVFRILFSLAFSPGDDRNDILTAVMSNGVGFMVPVGKSADLAPFYGFYLESDGIDDEGPGDDGVEVVE